MDIEDFNEQQFESFTVPSIRTICVFPRTILGSERVLPEHHRINFLGPMSVAFYALRRLVVIYESDNGEQLSGEKCRRLNELFEMLHNYIQRLDNGFELFLLMGSRQLHFSPGDLQPHCAQFFVLDRDTLNLSGDLFDADDYREHDRGVMEFKEKLVALRGNPLLGEGRGHTDCRELSFCKPSREFTTTVHNVIEEFAANDNEPGWIPGRGDYSYANQEPRNDNNRHPAVNNPRHDLRQLELAVLAYNLQALPMPLQEEYTQLLRTADMALGRLAVSAYGGYPLTAQQDLLTAMRRHLSRLAEVFIRFGVQDVVVEQQRNGNRSLYSEHIITARPTLLALVRSLIGDLRNRPFPREQDLYTNFADMEQGMMLAASHFMATLQEMTIAVYRHIEANFVNGH
ncbi:hypothetical protein TYRP_016950 [Tyrophagus putrescentiae]|nr:hypothetical protein TYRP_016950 [Tyrophagus putrescentiae]